MILCDVGNRVRILKMRMYNPVPAGATGTVTGIDSVGHGVFVIRVKWDVPNKWRNQNILAPDDEFEVIGE